jgi:thymidylate synthase (FAD)
VPSEIGYLCAKCKSSGVDQRLINSEPGCGDEKLLRYLYTHGHMSPFEMAGATIEVQAPIFVFREWHRHRTQSYNEMSARYTPLPDVNYIPTVERLMSSGVSANKQAGSIGGHPVHLSDAEAIQVILRHTYESLESRYRDLLEDGVPKELARIILPVGRYSRMRASANLRNWLQFLTLRCDDAAQYEIRMYANALRDILIPLFPRTMELWGGDV